MREAIKKLIAENKDTAEGHIAQKGLDDYWRGRHIGHLVELTRQNKALQAILDANK